MTLDIQALHHVAVQARDWEESLKFYRDFLGMKVWFEFEMGNGRKAAHLIIGNNTIELFSPRDDMPDEPNHNPYLHIALTTPDIEKALETVREAGYEVTMEPAYRDRDVIKMSIAFFKGPNGELIELYQIHEQEGM